MCELLSFVIVSCEYFFPVCGLSFYFWDVLELKFLTSLTLSVFFFISFFVLFKEYFFTEGLQFDMRFLLFIYYYLFVIIYFFIYILYNIYKCIFIYII